MLSLSATLPGLSNETAELISELKNETVEALVRQASSEATLALERANNATAALNTLVTALGAYTSDAAIDAAVDAVVTIAAQPGVDAKTVTDSLEAIVTGGTVGSTIVDTVAAESRSYYSFTDDAETGAIGVYPASRQLVFNVTDSRPVRFDWFDARVVTHNPGLAAACEWEFMFDSSPDPCPSGSIIFIQRNDEDTSSVVSSLFSGVCEGLSVGEHTLKIRVSAKSTHPGSNCVVGWEGGHVFLGAQQLLAT